MVVVLGHYTFNVVKTGKVVDNDFVHAFELADGKISTSEGYEDSAAVVAAFTPNRTRIREAAWVPEYTISSFWRLRSSRR